MQDLVPGALQANLQCLEKKMGEAITAKATERVIKTIPALRAEKGSQAVEGTRLRTIPPWYDKHEQAWAHEHASCIT